MSPSPYSEARTLVRRLCRLPGEDPAQFKSKIARLRVHFERFNVDVSELCQWLMCLRRQHVDADHPESFGLFGDFLLEPALEGVDADESERARWRLAVFDDVVGIRPAATLAERPVPQLLRAAMDEASAQAGTPTARKLFGRMRGLEPAHRLVLLKAAADWVVAHYRRGVENWVRQHEEWERERTEWEGRHPALTAAIRDEFTDVFKALKDPAGDGSQGVQRKNPRICPYDRLRENKHNCIYAGEKGHAPRCWKYVDFLKAQEKRDSNFKKQYFPENAEKYIEERRKLEKSRALERLYRSVPQCKGWFEDAWNEYLKAVGLDEQEVRCLPHCLKIGETWENSQCQWNPHTDLCKQYKGRLDNLDADTLAQEPSYREWRRSYLAGPRKPSFRYPSSRELPMPKIFGADFHQMDFDRSVLRLRLDDMPENQCVEFGFIPWPSDYRPTKDEVEVTSVHVNFLGTRARVGFRFDAPHATSRFGCMQDELDELRSRCFPRQAQDQEFLNAARTCLLKSFSGDAQRDLRLVSVDLGETGAHASVYRGTRHETDVPLPILKVDQLYSCWPEVLAVDKARQPDRPRQFVKDDPRGLRKEHVGRHLTQLAQGAAAIAQRRHTDNTTPATVGGCDQRTLKRHVAWMIRDWVRLNAARVVAVAEQHRCDLIVFESLRGFRPPGYDQLGEQTERKKRWMAMFAFGRVRRKVTEKAVERGLRVVTVPYFKSSQFCCACGHEQQDKKRWRADKAKGKFSCQCGRPRPADRAHLPTRCSCTAKLDSNANAARVLARVFWNEIRLPQPASAAARS